MTQRHPTSTLFPYTTLFRSRAHRRGDGGECLSIFALALSQGEYELSRNRFDDQEAAATAVDQEPRSFRRAVRLVKRQDRKSSRLNSSHGYISYAVFCLKKKT